MKVYTLISLLALSLLTPINAQERDGRRGDRQEHAEGRPQPRNIEVLEEQAKTARQQARAANARAKQANEAAERAKVAARRAENRAKEAQAKLDAAHQHRPNTPPVRPNVRG